MHYCNLARMHRAVEARGQPTAGDVELHCSTTLLRSPDGERATMFQASRGAATHVSCSTAECLRNTRGTA